MLSLFVYTDKKNDHKCYVENRHLLLTVMKAEESKIKVQAGSGSGTLLGYRRSFQIFSYGGMDERQKDRGG